MTFLSLEALSLIDVSFDVAASKMNLKWSPSSTFLVGDVVYLSS